MFKLFNRKKKSQATTPKSAPKQKSGYWVTPKSLILPDYPNGTASLKNEISLAEIAEMASQLIPCKGVSYSVGSSVMTYNLKLNDIKHLSKAKKLPEMIYAMTGRKATHSPTRTDGAHFSLSVERAERETLYFKNAIERDPFAKTSNPSSCVMGANSAGKQLGITFNDSMPHLLVAGQAGGGKSVLLHSIICSMLFKASPSTVQFLMIDVKLVELTKYNDLPHLLCPVITDARGAIAKLKDACDIMDDRYRRIEKGDSNFPKLIVVIDELADLMMLSKSEVESAIVRLCQKGRAAGIHVILATQSPRASVLTGLIRSNVPGRIGLRCATAVDSRICIERNGCEQLTGKGDGFFINPSNSDMIRFQAAYISDADINSVVSYWKNDGLTTVPPATVIPRLEVAPSA